VARVVYPGIPHHGIQRGNHRQEIFLEDSDRHYYLKWMLSLAIDNKVPIIGYCLMTNHIHLLLLPQTVTGLINFMKVLSQRYTQYFNYTYHRTGKLWGNRYKLHPFEPETNSALLRYVERNPLRAGIVDNVIPQLSEKSGCFFKDWVI
jgi:putative transposase